ncbi:glutamine amidotransferase-related protein [Erwinia tasmaniensis]|uniref:glutamine amidotransferase-related protein n=1 Tax=Erwinia tasmaniensis TaxID=338565 RepID=UPI003A4D26B6
MSLTFILDDARLPAHYGACAIAWARQQRLPLWSLRPTFSGDYPDSHQHVVAAGYCVTSGLYPCDPQLREVSDIAQLPAHDAVVVLAARDAGRVARLPGNRLYAQRTGGLLQLCNAGGSVLLQQPVPGDRPRDQPVGEPLLLGLVGREADHREVYPATLAALDDAARQSGIPIRLRFLPPDAHSDRLDELNELDAVVLPGGASMAAVSGQIRVANATLQSHLPTLGLCLGMQSMATAAVRLQPGCDKAILAEVAPDAALHSFILFGDGAHRCGLLPFTPAAPLPGPLPPRMHYNHRYRFNPALRAQLAASGIVVTAETAGTVEAISLPDHPFWHGVQGHPELQSRPEAPHGLFTALLNAALSQRDAAARIAGERRHHAGQRRQRLWREGF